MLVIVMGLAQNWRWVSIACLLMVTIILFGVLIIGLHQANLKTQIVIWAVCLLFVPETPAHFIRFV